MQTIIFKIAMSLISLIVVLSGSTLTQSTTDTTTPIFLLSYEGYLHWAGWTSDGRQLLVTSSPTTKCDNCPTVTITRYDAKTFKPQFSFDFTGTSSSSTYTYGSSPDGNFLARVGREQGVQVWDLTDGQLLLDENLPVSAQWNPTDSFLWLHSNNRVRIWNAAKNAIVVDKTLEKPIDTLFWSPDGKRLVIFLQAANRIVLDSLTGEIISTPELRGASPTSLEWSKDVTNVLAFNGGIRIWNIETGKTRFSFAYEGIAMLAAHWSPDETMLLSHSADSIYVFDVKEGDFWDPEIARLTIPYKGKTGRVLGSFWLPDSKHFIFYAQDGTAHLVDVTTGKDIYVKEDLHGLQREIGEPGRVIPNADKSLLAADVIWDTFSGKEVLHPTHGSSLSSESPVVIISDPVWHPKGHQILTIARPAYNRDGFTNELAVWAIP